MLYSLAALCKLTTAGIDSWDSVVQEWFQTIAMVVVDVVFAGIPRRRPDRASLDGCKIVSHRGEHDNCSVMENTLPAFSSAVDQGVWGIECDIRWTQDLVPVICHDPSGERLFGYRQLIGDMQFDDLRKVMPMVPTLSEVVQSFGGRAHLMLEIKEAVRDRERQQSILEEILSLLVPGKDYHFLALDADLFELVDFLPGRYCLPVAELNVKRLSQAAIDGELGGLTGHFLLLGRKLQARLEARGQRVGTGFIRSRYSLYRELARGVEWIFSNDAVKLQKILRQDLAKLP